MTDPSRRSATRPTRLTPVFLEKVWGSTNLAPWFPNPPNKIGEVWFDAKNAPPILVKFLFTSEKLSVQVHPSGPAPVGKTEMWHILRAEPGARIALGFRQPISRERLRDAAHSGEIEALLRWFPVKAGETYFTPAPTVHAIGAGIALCEIQQHSDITYRLYDYGRPRELHVEEAVAIADLGVHAGASVGTEKTPGRELLVCCEHFETEILTREPETTGDGPALLVILEGRGTIGDAPFAAGEVWQIPEGADQVTVAAEGVFRALRVNEPHG